MATTKRVNWNGFSVSNLRTSRGVEYEAYSCDLMLNGKKVAEVIEDGWGGPLNIDMMGGFSYKKLDAVCNTFREPTVYKDVEVPFDAEIFISELVQKEQMARDVRRQNNKGYGICKVEFGNFHRDEYFNVPLPWSDEKLGDDMKRKFPKDPIKAITFWRNPSDLDLNDKPVRLEQILVGKKN